MHHPLLCRYECKYLVSDEQAARLRSYLRPFLRPDRFGLGADGRGYPICSLYLDTVDFRLLEQTLRGEKNRFKLRLRTYTEAREEPVFLEIKRRVDGVVLKRRATLQQSQASDLFRSLGPPGRRPTAVADSGALEEFLALMKTLEARPAMRVRYLREAYESAAGEPLRMTFDTAVAHAPAAGFEIGHNGPSWRPTPIPGIVFEIKFTERFPGWVATLVRELELERTSVAKYGLSMIAYLGSKREAGTGVGVRRQPVLGTSAEPGGRWRSF